VIHRIRLAPSVCQSLRDITDRRVQAKLQEAIDGLAEEPGKQGKALIGELRGYRSLRAVRQRFRIIYRVDASNALVLIVAVGIRKAGSKKDVYALARKLLRLRLVEPPQQERAQAGFRSQRPFSFKTPKLSRSSAAPRNEGDTVLNPGIATP
jgi:mRNA interferase RelE/StbE